MNFAQCIVEGLRCQIGDPNIKIILLRSNSVNDDFQEAVETAFGQGKLTLSAKNVLLGDKVKSIASDCADEMVATSGVVGSKLSVFLDWLFSDPSRVLELLLKIIAIFSSKGE